MAHTCRGVVVKRMVCVRGSAVYDPIGRLSVIYNDTTAAAVGDFQGNAHAHAQRALRYVLILRGWNITRSHTCI